MAGFIGGGVGEGAPGCDGGAGCGGGVGEEVTVGISKSVEDRADDLAGSRIDVVDCRSLAGNYCGVAVLRDDGDFDVVSGCAAVSVVDRYRDGGGLGRAGYGCVVAGLGVGGPGEGAVGVDGRPGCGGAVGEGVVVGVGVNTGDGAVDLAGGGVDVGD